MRDLDDKCDKKFESEVNEVDLLTFDLDTAFSQCHPITALTLEKMLAPGLSPLCSEGHCRSFQTQILDMPGYEMKERKRWDKFCQENEFPDRYLNTPEMYAQLEERDQAVMLVSDAQVRDEHFVITHLAAEKYDD